MQDCRKLAAANDMVIVGEYIDDDRSAYSGKPRPAYKQMSEVLNAGAADYVLAWHPDRLTRQPRELEDLIDLLERTRTQIRTATTGDYDLSTPSGRMAARIVGAVARGESEHKSARLRRKHEELAENGRLSGGGTRPFGYDDDRVTVRKDEADVIRDLAARALAGASIYSLVEDLNRRGVPTASGKQWRSTVVRRLLTSGRIAGLREHRGKTTTAVWQPIISVEEHRLLKAIGDANRSKPRRARRKYLLSGGLLRCGVCGRAMNAQPKTGYIRRDGTGLRTIRGYYCIKGANFGGCGKIRCVAEPLEQLVSEAVLTVIDTPSVSAALSTGSDGGGDVAARLAVVEGRLTELGEMFAAGEVDRAGWRAARDKLEAERADLASRAQAGASARIATGDVRQRWDGMGVDARRAVLDAVLEAVVIGPAIRGRNVFDPNRVTLRWKV